MKDNIKKMSTPQKIKKLRHLNKRRKYNDIKMERVAASRDKIEDEILELYHSISQTDRSLYHDPLKKLV